MENIFETKYLDFVESDVRKNRTTLGTGYIVNSELLFVRNLATLPPESVVNKTILDLGCCVGSSGAWVLEHGASRYVGVELQERFVALAKKNLTKHFNHRNWEIIESSFDDFFVNNSEHFDIVVAGGIIYTSIWYQDLVREMAKVGDTIVVESEHPVLLNIPEIKEIDGLEYLPIVQYRRDGPMVLENASSIKALSCFPSISALSLLFEEQGFTADLSQYEKLKKDAGHLFNRLRRFVIVFHRTNAGNYNDFAFLYKNAEKRQVIPWSSSAPTQQERQRFLKNRFDVLNYIDCPDKTKQWVFDAKIASDFVSHAKKHIPNYDAIIDQSVEICKTTSTRSKIIDVGCATGETLRRLYAAGFTNLVGVDASQPMIDQCSTDIARLYVSDQFPSEDNFDVIICNWTLHFIKHKEEYVASMFKKLKPGGMLILTDKTADDGFDLMMYHRFKSSCGLTDKEIEEKQKSLEGVMFINSPMWYLSVLPAIGFASTTIINATYCFTTFLATK